MRSTMLAFILLIGASSIYCDIMQGKPYRSSDALILSVGGAYASALYQTVPPGPYNIGYQRLFDHFGFGVSLQGMSLEDSGDQYPASWSDDGYVVVRQIQMSVKPVFVIAEPKLFNSLDSLFYGFGVLVLKDRFVKGYETFSLAEFLPYEAGLGLGFDVRLLGRLAVFCEASYFNRGMELDDEEYSEKRMDHYFLEVVVPMMPRIEAGLKLYL